MKSEIKTKGYPPTVREICAALQIKSTSTAHKDIASLVQQGYLKKDPSKPRALMVVDAEDKAASSDRLQPVEREDIIDVPVVGRLPPELLFWRSRTSRRPSLFRLSLPAVPTSCSASEAKA